LALWIGQLFSQLADRIYIYVLLIAAYQMTHTNLGVSIPMLAFGAASVSFGIMAGAYVDRADHKATLVGTNWIRAAFVLVTYPFLDNSLVMLFILSFCIYTATQFFAPAEAASIPELISKENLVVANSLFMTTWIGSSVIGIGLGAPLVMFLGSAGTLTLSAALYAAAGLLLLFVPLHKHPRRADRASEPRPSVWSEVSMGIEFVRRNTVVATALIKMFAASAALAVVSLLALTFARDVLKIGELRLSYFCGGGGDDRGDRFSEPLFPSHPQMGDRRRRFWD
jgi:predicted MFS family arabinose efflux permease